MERACFRLLISADWIAINSLVKALCGGRLERSSALHALFVCLWNANVAAKVNSN